VPWKLLKQCLYCGHIRITIRPVWPVVVVHLRTKQFVSGTWNSSRVAACALRNEEAVRAHRLRLSSVCVKRLSGALRSQLARGQKVGQKLGVSLPLLTCSFLPCLSWLLHSRVRKSRRVIHKSLQDFRTRLRHFSSRLPSSGGTCKYAKAPSTKKLGEILYLLICSFLPCLSWLLRSRVRKSRRDFWITLYNSTFCPHSVFMCFVWIWEQTAIIFLYTINWLVCITETECLLCGTDWVFIYCSTAFGIAEFRRATNVY
jgi:hypothetical protein